MFDFNAKEILLTPEMTEQISEAKRNNATWCKATEAYANSLQKVRELDCEIASELDDNVTFVESMAQDVAYLSGLKKV